MVSLDDPKVRAAYEEAPLPRMSFGDHLDELRRRLLRSLITIVVCMTGVLFFKYQVQAIVIEPYRLQWQRGFVTWVETLKQKEAAGTISDLSRQFLANCLRDYDAILAGNIEYPHLLPTQTGFALPYNLFALGGLDDMFAFMYAALVFAFVLAAPIVVWQAWAFVAAGLYPKERKLFYRYFPFMIGLFASGVLFGYWIALPYSLGFLIRLMQPDQVSAMLGIGQYLNLVFGMTAAMGLVFQLPLVMVALQRVGLVTHRGFTKNWRMTVFVIFIAAAVFTPPDPVSMMMMATPMVVLYALGLLLTWMGRAHEPPVIEVVP